MSHPLNSEIVPVEGDDHDSIEESTADIKVSFFITNIKIKSILIFHRINNEDEKLSMVKFSLILALFTIICMVVGIIVVCTTSKKPGK
jgi:hypothetical protein